MLKLPYPVVLASASPRRRELLAELIPDFQVAVSSVDEESLTTGDPIETAEVLARAKAQEIARRFPRDLVIGSDTVVALGDRQLSKPRDANDARQMLRALSGQAHEVITGVCLCWPGGERVFSDVTRVRFRPLTDSEIAAYVRSGEPMDKAGAYAIQGGAKTFVERSLGSLSNVIGLPLEALERELAKIVERAAK